MADGAALETGDFCTAVYAGNRRYRARITGAWPLYLLIAHVAADGALVIDPDGTTRLFHRDTLRSVATVADSGEPLATLEPEPKEARDAA